MHNTWSFLVAHQTISILVAYYILSAAIGALPAPTAESHMFYAWLFKFANTLGGNLTRAFASKIEASPNFIPAAQKAVEAGQVPKP